MTASSSPSDFSSGDAGSEEEGKNMPDRAASDPEAARAAAEDALARVEALADLSEDPAERGEPTDEPGATREGTSSSEAAEDASGARPVHASDPDEGVPEDQCENCGALLHGPYCSQCGQKAADRIVPLWHMVNEGLEAVFELDLRVLHTLPKFLFLPGHLTKEYLNGRRTRYIRPFRLYLFATFLLFTVLAFTTTGGVQMPFPPAAAPTPTDTTQAAPASEATTSDTTAPEALRIRPGEASMFGPQEERDRVADRIEQDTGRFEVSVFGDPATNERMERMMRKKIAQTVRNPWEFVEGMIDRGPYVMFFMLPLFALLLKLLYVRHGRLYMEHLIFSLHVHAHAFIAFTIGILLGESDVGWLNTVGFWVELSPLLYLVLALRHVYEQGFLKSVLKTVFLLVVYSIILSFGFLFLLLVALLLM